MQIINNQAIKKRYLNHLEKSQTAIKIAFAIFSFNRIVHMLSGSVVILGGLSFVNSPHAYTFASLKRGQSENPVDMLC